MKFRLPENKVFRFLFFFFCSFLAWDLLYEYVLHPHEWLDKPVINLSSIMAKDFLDWFGYKTFIEPNPIKRTIGIDGSTGVWIGDACNGITLFMLFTLFIVSYPGPWKHKAWFIPTGIVIIHLCNVFRIMALCIMARYKREWLDFNHTYTFQLLMYVIIFLLWLWWMKRYSGLKLKTDRNAPAA
jgi:exosortase family protein XrtF